MTIKLPLVGPIFWKEVLFACGYGILLAGIGSLAQKKKWVNKLGRKIRVSSRYSDEDVWEVFFESDDTVWVYVRDKKYKLIYLGAVEKFSDSRRDRELVLREVSVYDEDSNLLYEVPALYISRNKDDLTIEYPRAEKKADSVESKHKEIEDGSED